MSAGETVADLIAASIDPVRLMILVFGPDVTTPSSDERTRNLQNKRKEIREALEVAGHFVKYAEELIDPTLTGPTANPLFQERVLMEAYDLIVNLVGSPGTIVEATMIAERPNLAVKAALYLDDEHASGLTAQACRQAETFGARFQTYTYPRDLVECHLLTHITDCAKVFQMRKFLL
jgi:hypothetical protein